MRLGRRDPSRDGSPLSKRALLQHVNRELWALSGGVTPVPLYCECGRDDCVDSVDLGADDFAAARAYSSGAIVLPEHRAPGEPLLATFDGYLIVLDGDAAAPPLDADRMPDGLQL